MDVACLALAKLIPYGKGVNRNEGMASAVRVRGLAHGAALRGIRQSREVSALPVLWVGRSISLRRGKSVGGTCPVSHSTVTEVDVIHPQYVALMVLMGLSITASAQDKQKAQEPPKPATSVPT